MKHDPDSSDRTAGRSSGHCAGEREPERAPVRDTAVKVMRLESRPAQEFGGIITASSGAAHRHDRAIGGKLLKPHWGLHQRDVGGTLDAAGLPLPGFSDI